MIIPVPLESTVSYKPGTSQAPKAILDATDQLEFYEEDECWSPMLYMTVTVTDPIILKKKEDVDEYHARLTSFAASLPKNNLTIVLGGEHSITPSIIEGRMRPPGTVIHLDAHADLRTKYAGSEFNHACAIFRVCRKGYSVISIGIRSMFEDEAKYISRYNNPKVYTDRSLRQPKTWKKLIRNIGDISGYAWLTIDMDAFNPAFVPGVGTPQPGGLEWYQVIDILETLIKNPSVKLMGMDIVELIPESSCVSNITAAKIIQKAISFWGKSRKYYLRPPKGAQTLINFD